MKKQQVGKIGDETDEMKCLEIKFRGRKWSFDINT
jgi:hypothetical protein